MNDDLQFEGSPLCIRLAQRTYIRSECQFHSCPIETKIPILHNAWQALKELIRDCPLLGDHILTF